MQGVWKLCLQGSCLTFSSSTNWSWHTAHSAFWSKKMIISIMKSRVVEHKSLFKNCLQQKKAIIQKKCDRRFDQYVYKS